MAWCNLGAALLRLPVKRTSQDQERAIAAFEKALDLNPTAPHVAYNVGLIRRDRQEWQQAVAAFGRALEADPKDRDARALLERMRAYMADERRHGDDGEGGRDS